MGEQTLGKLEVPGKWILAGEHTVLRGGRALVFPLHSRQLRLSFHHDQTGAISLELSGEHGEEVQFLIWSVLEKACELLSIKRTSLSGLLKIQSEIPVGSGLGASAALCVAVSRWLVSLGFLESDRVFVFARTLENLFHGESSGVDVAVAASRESLIFTRQEDSNKPLFEPFSPLWSPRIYLSYTGLRGMTKDCVLKVKHLLNEDPQSAGKIDNDMKLATEIAIKALSTSNVTEGEKELAAAMSLAQSAFQRWGLVPSQVQQQIDRLREAGALAVKLTGSGSGGYLISLWPAQVVEPQVKGIPRGLILAF